MTKCPTSGAIFRVKLDQSPRRGVVGLNIDRWISGGRTCASVLIFSFYKGFFSLDKSVINCSG